MVQRLGLEKDRRQVSDLCGDWNADRSLSNYIGEGTNYGILIRQRITQIARVAVKLQGKNKL